MTFILIIVLIIWIFSLSGRISELEKKLGLKGKVAEPEIKPSDDIVIPKEAPEFKPIAAQVSPAGQIHAITQPVNIASPATPKKTEAQETEDAVGWLNKIGVVALVLGMGFFFKYAVDQGWINEWTRVIIGFIVSGLLVYLGELWKTKFGNRAHALIGGGIALSYFTIYAGYNFYHIFPQLVAFALMLGVAGFSVWLSNKHSSLVLGALGFFGAYGAPPLLGSGTNQQIQLFVYLTIMNVAAVAILIRKFWMELLALALVGTIADFVLWGYAYSSPENALVSMFFVIVTTTLFVMGLSAITRYHNSKNPLPQNTSNNLGAFSFLVGLFYFMSAVFLLERNFHGLLAPIALLGSVVFFLAYAMVDRLEFKIANYFLSFIGSALLVSAAVWNFDGKALGLALLGISLLVGVVGYLQKREELKVWGIIIIFVSLLKSLYEPYPLIENTFLFNAKFGLMFANTLGLLFMGWIFEKSKVKESDKNLESVFQIVAAVVFWVALSWDISAYFSPLGGLLKNQYMSLWWVLYPAFLALVAVFDGRKRLFQVSLIMLLAALFKVLALDFGPQPSIFYNAKFGLMVLTTLVMLMSANLSDKLKEESLVTDVLKVTASMLFWFAVSWEIVKHYELSISHNARNLFLSLWWIVYAVFLMFISNLAKSSVFRKVAIVLFGFSIVKVFLYDVQALDTAYRIISFVVLGVILLGVSFTYKKNKEKITHFLEGEGDGR